MSKLSLPLFSVDNEKRPVVSGEEMQPVISDEEIQKIDPSEYLFIKECFNNTTDLPLNIHKIFEQIGEEFNKKKKYFDKEYQDYIDTFVNFISKQKDNSNSYMFNKLKIQNDIYDSIAETAKLPEFSGYDLSNEFNIFLKTNPEESVDDFIDFLQHPTAKDMIDKLTTNMDLPKDYTDRFEQIGGGFRGVILRLGGATANLFKIIGSAMVSTVDVLLQGESGIGQITDNEEGPLARGLDHVYNTAISKITPENIENSIMTQHAKFQGETDYFSNRLNISTFGVWNSVWKVLLKIVRGILKSILGLLAYMDGVFRGDRRKIRNVIFAIVLIFASICIAKFLIVHGVGTTILSGTVKYAVFIGSVVSNTVSFTCNLVLESYRSVIGYIPPITSSAFRFARPAITGSTTTMLRITDRSVNIILNYSMFEETISNMITFGICGFIGNRVAPEIFNNIKLSTDSSILSYAKSTALSHAKSTALSHVGSELVSYLHDERNVKPIDILKMFESDENMKKMDENITTRQFVTSLVIEFKNDPIYYNKAILNRISRYYVSKQRVSEIDKLFVKQYTDYYNVSVEAANYVITSIVNWSNYRVGEAD